MNHNKTFWLFVFSLIILTNTLSVNAFAVGIPVATDDSVIINSGLVTLIDILGNDLTAGRTFTVNIVTPPTHGTIPLPNPLDSQNFVTYTSSANYSGLDSFQYTITNSAGTSNVATVSITVKPTTTNANKPPVANSDSFTTLEGSQNVVLNVIANDNDPDGDPLTIVEISGSQHGSAKISSDQKSVTYTPYSGYFGQDSFTYTISDGFAHGSITTETGTITITINKVNFSPKADNLNFETLQDTSTKITLSGNDPNGDSVTYNIVSQPSHGILNGTVPNLMYTPNSAFVGIDQFTYKLFDGSSYSQNAIVEIQIHTIKSNNNTQSSTSSNTQSSTSSNTQSSTSSNTQSSTYQIPHWIKNNAKVWQQGQIDDSTFASGIQYLIKQGVIQLPPMASSQPSSSVIIPSWVKTDAELWANEQISDDDFVKSIQFLVQNGIINIKN